MKWRSYVQSKAITLCFWGIGLLVMIFILGIGGVGAPILIMGVVFLVLCIGLWLLCGWLYARERLRKIERILDELPDKYLMGEVLPEPVDAVEMLYFQVMRSVSRSAVGAVEAAVRQREEYCAYVESWIHEMKTPLTACSLILDNDGDPSKLKRELKRADNLTESILYFARMRSLSRDTKITNVCVADVFEEAVKSQMALLIAAGIRVEIQGDMSVHTDGKSLGFIIKQLLINCAKYCPGCLVTLTAGDGRIVVRDNGIGIPDYDLRRVTERGFTGNNGRRLGGSTGMGLFIVKGLCDQLGIGLTITSELGKYTCVALSFKEDGVSARGTVDGRPER